jgi:hypothetical protein
LATTSRTSLLAPLRGRHPLSTRSRCAPMRSQRRLLRLPAPASLTAGASAAASARSQILLQQERAQCFAQPDGAVDDHVRTRVPAPALPRAAPHHAEACLRGLLRPTTQPIALGRLSSLRPTGCTLPTSRPTCRRPPRGDSRFPPTSATCASRPRCPRCSRRCCCRHELSTPRTGWRTTTPAPSPQAFGRRPARDGDAA